MIELLDTGLMHSHHQDETAIYVDEVNDQKDSLDDNVKSSLKEHFSADNHTVDSTEHTTTNAEREHYSDEDETDMLTPTSSSKNKPNYHRHPKPPFSYIALIAMAIKDSPTGKLTLAEINEYLMKRFPFFRGSYTGWRNSIRHNLSLNECFTKILRDPSRPWGKDNYWTINENSEYTFADGVFRRRRKRMNRSHNSDKSHMYGVRMIGCHDQQKQQQKSKGKFTGPFSIDSILGNTDFKDEESGEEPVLDDNRTSPSDTYHNIEQRAITCPRDSNYEPAIKLLLPPFRTHHIRSASSVVSSLEHLQQRYNAGITNRALGPETFQVKSGPNYAGDVLAAVHNESLQGEHRVRLPWGHPIVPAGIHARIYFAPVPKRNHSGLLVENLII